MDRERRTFTARNIWRLTLAIIGAIAIAQELRKPPHLRTWHGMVAGLIPYDFRLPTVDRIRNTYWNPDGPLISGKVFGVGWAPNFGWLAKLFDKPPG
jgi:hypothetical protein